MPQIHRLPLLFNCRHQQLRRISSTQQQDPKYPPAPLILCGQRQQGNFRASLPARVCRGQPLHLCLFAQLLSVGSSQQVLQHRQKSTPALRSLQQHRHNFSPLSSRSNRSIKPSQHNGDMRSFDRMMEWGLLPPGVAKKVHEKKQTRNHQQKLRSPTKVVSVAKTTDVSVKTVKKTTTQSIVKTASKKRKGGDLVSDEDDDDDFVLSNIKNKKRKVSA